MIELELNDIAEITSSKRIFYSDYVEEGIPFYRSREIINLDNGEDLKELIFITQEKYLDIKNKFGAPEKDDILITSVGTIGNTYIVRENDEFYFKDGNLTWLRNWKGKTEPKFVFYWLKSPIGQGKLYQQLIGSSQKALTIAALKKIKIEFPEDKTTQRKIASILSAYDDLIENNLKRIKLLEEKAQLHYKEVMQDSSKWDKVKLEEFVSVVKGRKPANVLEQPEDDSLLYLLLDTVERTKTLYTSDLTLPLSKDTDVLMCMDGARSGLAFRGMNGAIGSTMAIWRSNSERVSGEFLYQYMKQNESAIIQGNTGAAIPHANRKFILDMKMAMPPKKEAEYFDSLTLPLIKLINTLHNQNTKLREARDILLPRLMNGQIEV